ncbi:MAG: recombination regulator RecX [Neisseria sp.]|nr:recombination regulator RecX [Neisseria sp.]
MSTQKSLRARAMDILSRREVSRLELKRKLAAYAESEEEIDAVLEEFSEHNWQSDERYAEAYIHSKSPKHGILRLKQGLAAKGVEKELVETYLPDSEQELQNACAVLRKKFKVPPEDWKEQQRYLRFLAYRGFTSDSAYRALDLAWEEEETE